MSLSLRQARALLIDMDGVLFRGGTALPGAAGFLPWLERNGISYMLLTNNSTLTPPENARQLSDKGVRVDPSSILTSALATADYLIAQGAASDPVFVVGESGLVDALTQAGISCVNTARAEWVVTGLDRMVTYEKLRIAALALEGGARWVATNADTSLPVEEGLVPGAGAIQAAITATTGRRPVVVGKPEPRMLTVAIERLGIDAAFTLVLGDRLDTDIAAARRAGLESIMVLTGVSTRADLASGTIQPDLVVDDLPMLMRMWERELGS